MKHIKTGTVLLVAVLVLFTFCLGLFLGRQTNSGEILLCTEKAAPSAELCPAAVREEPSSSGNSPQQEKENSGAASPAVPVNINTATKEQLMTLPGIGDVLSQRILDYREAHGKFDSAEELMEVSGIGEKKMEDILEYVTVEDENENTGSR